MSFVKGYKMSEEHKRKIGEANKIALKGKPLSKNARIAWLKKYSGVPRPLYVRQITSKYNIENNHHLHMHTPEAKIKRFLNLLRGEKHPCWMGGKSKEKYTKTFSKSLKLAIKRRDNFKCTSCGVPEEELMKAGLVIHHIDENKSNNYSTNLISLCRSCHLKTHWEIKNAMV